MKPPRHLVFVVSSMLLAGCAAPEPEDDSIAAPPPSEATVFAATPDTKDATGITKWGFSADARAEVVTYRGYGDRNEVIASVERRVDRSDPNRYRFSLSAASEKGSAQEKLELSTRPSADGTKTEIVVLVTENSFVEGSFPSRVLARFQADANLRGAGAGSLVANARPLGEDLVAECSDTAARCQVELIDQRIAAAAAAGDCSLINIVGSPLVGAVVGAIVGAVVTSPTGPGAIGGAIGGAVVGTASGAATAVYQCINSIKGEEEATQKLETCRHEAEQACRSSGGGSGGGGGRGW